LGKKSTVFSSQLNEYISPQDTIASLNETLSYAAYKILKHRFKNFPNSKTTLDQFDDLMSLLNYDTTFTSVDYSNGDPAALGNYDTVQKSVSVIT
jgi:hypothetical protein